MNYGGTAGLKVPERV